MGPAPHKKSQITESILQQVSDKDSWPGVIDHNPDVCSFAYNIVSGETGSPAWRSKRWVKAPLKTPLEDVRQARHRWQVAT